MTLPDKTALLNWIRENPRHATKREIARAFAVSGADRVELKRLLRELGAEGAVEKGQRRYAPPGHLPPVAVMVGAALSDDGELTLRPQTWEGAEPPPEVVLLHRPGEPGCGVGDRLLCKLHPHHEGGALRYHARLIRKLAEAARRTLGVFRLTDGGGRILPLEKGADEMRVEPHDTGGAKDGELVEVEAAGAPRLGLRKVRVVSRLGDPSAPKAVSLIAIHQHGLPVEFSDAALAEAEAAVEVGMDGREDLRHLPLLTIDPPDARDHDDAVCALPDEGGGWKVWVAIADVAAYVRPGSALDRDARKRGNSCYFPDRVVPMLPERLSGDLCSLHEGVDRPCVAVEMRIDSEGRRLGHRFVRGMMRSPASLTYAQAQAIEDGDNSRHAPAVRDLFAAYRAAAIARDARAPLNLNLPERRIELSEEGKVLGVGFRERLEAHRLIEEFMVQANVCAAETLERRQRPLVYRVHEEPAPEKIEALREQVETVGLTLAKGQVLTTRRLNALLDAAQDGDFAELVNMGVLRAQTQAYYSPQNFGHFGLALKSYAHFTSPIRRYADLLVHRALITAHGWGPDPRADGQTPAEVEGLADIAKHISQTERRAMDAERDTTDRYLAAYLSEREGAEFDGRVSGVAKFGLFVKLDDTGADGIVPVSTLGREYWRFDADRQTLTGERSGAVIGVGARARVRLVEAAPVAGGLRFELLEIEGGGRAPQTGRGRGAGPQRKLARARIAAAKSRRKARRKRQD
ncbi:MAG: ribonuclease R [Rubrimonas sp.]